MTALFTMTTIYVDEHMGGGALCRRRSAPYSRLFIARENPAPPDPPNTLRLSPSVVDDHQRIISTPEKKEAGGGVAQGK